MRNKFIGPVISLTVVLVVLCVGELGARVYFAVVKDPYAELKDECYKNDPPCEHVYQMNTHVPGVNQYGYLGAEFTPERPEGVKRVMVLGDSVSLGWGVSPEQSFPSLLKEKLFSTNLSEQDVGEESRIELQNVSLPMYTPYNQLKLYEKISPIYRPDIVIISFCMNDVVNPLLHWTGCRSKQLPDLPPEAIPNLTFHSDYALPRLHMLSSSKLFCALDHHWNIFRRTYEKVVGPEDPPLYITGERNIDMRPLLDSNSSEWKWLRKTYDGILKIAARDGAKVILVIHPLGYQLSKQNPLSPQNQFKRYCQENNLLCIDPLPELQKKYAEGERFFRGETDEGFDVWHYNEHGHEVVTKMLLPVVEQLLAPSKRTSSAP